MITRKTVLCEVEFWKKFTEYFPEFGEFLDDKAQDSLKTWIEMYQFISRSKLIMNCSPSEFHTLAQNDNYLKYLWKKSIEDPDLLNFKDSHYFDNLEDILAQNPFGVLLTRSGRGPIAQKFGVININGGNVLTKGALFVDSGKALGENEAWDWEEFKRSIPDRASNSMIIVDNYILKNGERDLYKLLDALLPDCCEIGYHLTIFYYQERTGVQERLIQKIKQIRPNLVETLTLEMIRVVGSQEFHDRTIVTNNCWINIGGGFDMTQIDYVTHNTLVSRTTTMAIAYPGFCRNNILKIERAYTQLIEKAEIALQHAHKRSTNRLLEVKVTSTS